MAQAMILLKEEKFRNQGFFKANVDYAGPINGDTFVIKSKKLTLDYLLRLKSKSTIMSFPCLRSALALVEK